MARLQKKVNAKVAAAEDDDDDDNKWLTILTNELLQMAAIS